jgi:lipopolysaccharide export system protein LptA
MAVSTRTLRMVLVAGALLLVAVVVGFIGYAHYRAHKFLIGLPGRLGVNITQETDNFTYSQSLKGKTIFTVHASKAIGRKDGKITLHDVGIVLYGRKEDRADRIHGNEFEYDQKAGVLRAIGEAFIDLSAPAGQGADKTDGSARMIHVKTSGLVFAQKERSVGTDEGIEFEANGLTGNAVGASYDSASGVLLLKSAVKVSGLRGTAGSERPMVLTASRAEMDRETEVVLLDAPKYVSTGDSGAQTMTAEHAVVHVTQSGTPQNIEARGRVVLVDDGRGTVSSERMDVALNASGQPREGHLYGGVRFVNDEDGKRATGQAADVRVGFDGEGRPVRVGMTGAVEMNEKAGVSERQLNAEKVELGLSGGGKQKLVLRSAVASGGDGARFRSVDVKAGEGQGMTTLSVRSDVLNGRFAASGLTGLDGTGKTLVERVLMDGKGVVSSKETSTSDTLAVDFAQGAKGHMQLARATQRGGVEVVREGAKKGSKLAEVEHARGDEAVYEAAADRVTMTGAVQLSDSSSTLLADRVQMNRASGEGTADGNVRVTYMQGSAQAEPIHVLAARAVAHQSTGVTEFTAAAGGTARMWQGGSQVEAPVLDFDRNKRSVVAHGGDAAAVRAVLAGGDAANTKNSKGKGGPVRVASQEMTYKDASRQVEFRGRVRVEEKDGTMRADEATVFLTTLTAPANAAVQGLIGGRVDRVIGQGNVQLDEPGRKAMGEKIVYTAADESYVLTGTKAAPPKIVDEVRGTITGAALRFTSGDDSVVISGGDERGRVRSETRVRE